MAATNVPRAVTASAVEGNKVIEKFKKFYNQDLIPKDYFISEMAQIFNVSVQAMTYRLKNLDII